MAPRRMLYIRDIPVPIRQQISDFLDDPGALRNWRHLAGLLGFSNDDIAAFQRSIQRPGGSPSDEMLTTWDFENHTITDLYHKLFELRHARCMMLLRDLVDPSLHGLINQIRSNAPQAQAGRSQEGDKNQPHNQRPQPNPMYQAPDHGLPQRAPQYPQQHVAPPPFNPNVPVDLPQMPLPNRMQDPANPQQQQQQEFHSNKTPSTVSYHSDKHGLFQPIPGMMVNPPMPRSSRAASPQRVPGIDIQQHYPGNYGYNLQRVPSEHPIGPPQMYVSRCSNEDNFALPAPSPAAMSACRPPSFGPTQSPGTSTSDDSIEQYLSCTLEKPYREICEATHNFSDSFKLGEGSFGTVYHAQLNLTDYAIKKLKQNENVRFDQTKARRDQIKELSALVKYRGHPNIVSLCFYSIDGDFLCLIYEYLKNGSLEDCLQGRSVHGPLDWKTRHKIAEGSALGINYLHTAQATPLIHQDIKSANILLGENFEAKIADFGLARPGPKGGKDVYTILKTSTVCGTRAYLPHEFQSRYKLTVKLDVYSFGIVLMEIVTGMRAGEVEVPGFSQKLLSVYVQQIMERYDGNQKEIADRLCDSKCSDWPWQFVWKMLDLSMRCTAHNYKERPDMSEVVACLKGIRTETEEYERDRSSRRHVIPTENTEPIQYREGEESYVSSSLDDFGQTTATKSDKAMPTPSRRMPSPEAKLKDPTEQYNGYRALANGRTMIEGSKRDVCATETTCRSQLDEKFRQIQIQQIHPGGQVHLPHMPRTLQGNASRLPPCDQYHGALMGQEGYGTPSHYAVPAPGMHMFCPPQQAARTPSPVPSYRSDVTSSSQATGCGFSQRQQGYDPTPVSHAGYQQYQRKMYYSEAPQNSNPRYESPHSQFTSSSQNSMQAQPDLSRQAYLTQYCKDSPDIDEMENQRLYKMAELRIHHLQDLQRRNPSPDGQWLTSEQSAITISSTTSSPSSASSSSQGPPPRYPKMKTIVLRQLSSESSESSVLTENTSLPSLSEQESNGSGDHTSSPSLAASGDHAGGTAKQNQDSPSRVSAQPGTHHDSAEPLHDGIVQTDLAAQLVHGSEGHPSRVATQNTEPVHEPN